MIEANVVHESWRVGVQKLLFLGSVVSIQTCAQPMVKIALLTG